MAQKDRLRGGLLCWLLVLLASAGHLSAAQAPAGPAQPLDEAFRSFWDADSPEKAAAVSRRILDLRPAFDEVWQRLTRGRPYGAAPRGAQVVTRTVKGVSIDNIVDIPRNYDPSRRWPVRVQLHGGVGRPLSGRNAGRVGGPNRIGGGNQIYIHPRAWADAAWWNGDQVANIQALLDQVKRTYNVDESRVSLTGISDGGTGVYFLAMREATAWASCLPLNGQMLVLANPAVGADGELFFGNLANCPFYIVNGGRDPLYPAQQVAPLVRMMERARMPVSFRVYPEAGHNTDWWPEERPMYEAYVRGHPRRAHSNRLSWETERTDRYNRLRWLVIDELGRRTSDAVLDDAGRTGSAGSGDNVFAHRLPSGRVDVTRDGQTFTARTRGVAQFTLLLSRDALDMSKPVKVVVNDRTVFEGRVTEDLSTLLEWAARDNDRTMLYGAQLVIKVP